MNREKREIRQLKRDIKRAGVKRARLDLKRGLADDPEQAHQAAFDYGRHRSAGLNGIDRDSTRKRPGVAEVPEAIEE
jgi:hypothetical protein